jgi:tetratricopeptide (TPR) repeat protein
MINKKKTWMFMFFIFLSVNCLLTTDWCYSAFEQLSGGAKSIGMGESYLTAVDDADIINYNVGGLGWSEEAQASMSYGKLWWGVDDSPTRGLINFIYPITGNIGIGIGWHSITVNGMYTENAATIGTGRRMLRGLSFGSYIRLYHIKYGQDDYTEINPVFSSGYSRNAMGVGLGILWKKRSLSLALAVDDINGPDVGIKYEDKLPMKIKAGGSYTQDKFKISGDIIKEGSDIRVCTGGEVNINKGIDVRGGIGIGSKRWYNLSLGAGYRSGWWEINYGFVYPLGGLSNMYGTHHIGVKAYLKEVFRKKEEVIVPQKDREEAVNYYKQAKDTWKKGYYKKALELLIKAEEYDPDDERVKLAEAKIAQVAKYIQESSEDDKRQNLIRLGVGAYIDNEGKTALSSLRYANQLWPEDEGIEGLLGTVKAKYPEIAEKEKLIPGLNLVEQKLREALEYIYASKHTLAIDECMLALKLEPENVVAYQRFGSALFMLEQYEKARDVWQKAIELGPDHPDTPEIRQFLRQVDKKLGIKKPAIPLKK